VLYKICDVTSTLTVLIKVFSNQVMVANEKCQTKFSTSTSAQSGQHQITKRQLAIFYKQDVTYSLEIRQEM